MHAFFVGINVDPFHVVAGLVVFIQQHSNGAGIPPVAQGLSHGLGQLGGTSLQRLAARQSGQKSR